jgi:hypothetical protein
MAMWVIGCEMSVINSIETFSLIGKVETLRIRQKLTPSGFIYLSL